MGDTYDQIGSLGFEIHSLTIPSEFEEILDAFTAEIKLALYESDQRSSLFVPNSVNFRGFGEKFSAK